ncbi:hypothetical protein [Lysobacter humi (ex Lee et al. 2017)]
MFHSNRIPKLAFLALTVAIAYLLAISGQPRIADGGLSGEEMYFGEKALALLVPLALIANVVLGAVRASRAGSWPWLLACVFLWPVSLVYTLFVNRGHEA